jgi:hypothetical protein
MAIVIGAVGAWHFARLGLTLSHYDARAHLVVARRVIDSLTPGWRQLGAVWLPLPHLLNAAPVQLDWNFRTGFSGVLLSMVVLAWGLAALGRYLLRQTGSMSVAMAAPLAILANPNVLYVQSTPLTEPLLFGFALASLQAMDDWVARPVARQAHRAGLLLAGLVLTRYEGWCIGLVLIAVGFIAQPPWRVRTATPIVGYPAAAIIAFGFLSYFSSGVLLVTSGFYTPDNAARGNLAMALREITENTREIAGPVLISVALLGTVVALLRARASRGRSLLPLSLAAAAVLPLVAFHAGHPERVRYMVPLVVAAGALSGLGLAAIPNRARAIAAAAFLSAAVLVRPPFTSSAPMIVEAQWELPFHDARRAVSAYLSGAYDGSPILASMGSLAHYMQEASSIGLQLRNFVHEGNGDLWMDAVGAPRHHVRWILIEEHAYGGDMLARRAREDPTFLEGFTRVVTGGGLALYRRTN